MLANFLVAPGVALQPFSANADAGGPGDHEVAAVAALDLRLGSGATAHGLRAEPALGAAVRPALQDRLRGGASRAFGRVADRRQVADFELEGTPSDARLVVWLCFSSDGKTGKKTFI